MTRRLYGYYHWDGAAIFYPTAIEESDPGELDPDKIITSDDIYDWSYPPLTRERYTSYGWLKLRNRGVV